MPKDTEELRIKDSILSNMWLRAQLRQLGRSLYSHLTLQILIEFPNVLLSGKNFRTSERCPFIVPRWGHCLRYKFELRKGDSTDM